MGCQEKCRTKKLLIALCAAFFLLPLVFAADDYHGDHNKPSITVTGSWVETINKNDLVSGAGSDLQGVYTSASGQVTIDITNTRGRKWYVMVKKIDYPLWDARLQLYISRTSDGYGGRKVEGGETYQQVKNYDMFFFSGSQDTTGIKVQFKMTGASINISPSPFPYSTMLYYTVVDGHP